MSVQVKHPLLNVIKTVEADKEKEWIEAGWVKVPKSGAKAPVEKKEGKN